MRSHPAFGFDLRSFVAGSAVLLGVGCTQNVTPVGDGTGGEATSGTTGTAQGGNGGAIDGTGGAGAGTVSSVSTGGSATSTAIALLESEMSDIGAGGGDTGSTGVGGSNIDPNTLHVFVNDLPVACQNPYDGTPCGNHWSVSFMLTPEMQQPGTYSMEAVNGFFGISFDGRPDCGGGGGSFWDGEVQIASIDATGVSATFIGTSTLEFDANGSFTAVRCFQ